MGKKRKKALRAVILLAAAAVLGLAGSVAYDLRHLPDISRLERRNPERTALMDQRIREARAKGLSYRIEQGFVPYSAISPHLKKAVLVAEDAAFFSHQGIDYAELKEAIKTDWKKGRWARGGSTITMQLAKNLYLSTSKSLTRKLSEAVLARRMEGRLTKVRIFELYLNYIEWGDGLFGCQAAARRYFGCQASELTPEQAIRLASIIINPRRYGPFSDRKRMVHRRRWIAERMLEHGHLTIDQYRELKL